MAIPSYFNRCRLSLRALAVILGVIGVVFAWGGYELRHAWRQHHALSTIAPFGDSVEFVGRFSGDDTSIEFAAFPRSRGFRTLIAEVFRKPRSLFLLDASRMPASAMDAIGELSTLRDLNVIDTPPDTVAHLLQQTPHLQRLMLARCALDSQVTQEMGRLVQLEGLALRGVDNVADDVPALCQLKRIKRLELSVCRLTDSDLEKLLSCLTALQSLEIDRVPLSGPVMRRIGNLRNLEVLTLHGDVPTDGLRLLHGLTALRTLSIVTAERLTIESAHLPPGIRQLTLLGHPVSANTLSTLATFDEIRSLKIDAAMLSERNLKILAQLPNLRKLDLWDDELSDEAFNQLGSELPNCQIGRNWSLSGVQLKN